jgi:hypothetical protein
MKECLHCKKDISGRRDTAKFCSTSCRVMWNRKHGKKNSLNPIQTQALYNLMMEKLASVVNVYPTPQNGFDAPLNLTRTDEPKQWQEPVSTIRRSFEYYQKARLECENDEQWADLKRQIHSDLYLSSKQKTLLTT